MPIRSQNLRIALILTGIGLAVGAVEIGVGMVGRRRTRQELEALSATVHDARAAAEACQSELADAHRRFERFDTLVDSLHGRVTGMEGPRGVPQARYDEYMKLFNAYNDSVASWHLKADSLKDREATCDQLAEHHNVLLDSLKHRLADAGIAPS
jgi:uncharacterized protein YjiS (DUF1127 family)